MYLKSFFMNYVMNLGLKNLFSICVYLFCFLFLKQNIFAIEFNPRKIENAITIDGEINESQWNNEIFNGYLNTFHPLYGEKLPFLTKIYAVYDETNLYFAFKCEDKFPNLIKTSISRRDSISNDDWVGVIIDSMGNLQSSYEFYVNPSGIQDDGVTSAVNQNSFDQSPDFVWDSASKINNKGFDVEIKIPLSSIRFKNGDVTAMNIIFMRNINRLGKMGSYPEMHSGQSQFNSMVKFNYKNLKNSLKFEVLPSFTYSINKVRLSKESWSKSNKNSEIGVSIKYGFSSSVVGEATINPDYSQIESDAFQVEVNQKYPVFYSEKRPFFMEGKNNLDFTIVNGGMMISPVYTRKIVDPIWAAKLSGTVDKTSFTMLAAEDEALGRLDGIGGNSFYGVGRGKYSIGNDDSIGLLYSGYKYNEEKNNVFGTDFQYRLSKNLRFSFSYLFSKTVNESKNSVKGSAINTMFEYSKRELDAYLTFEKYDKDFIMESAFLRQTNFNKIFLYVAPNFYSNKSWLLKIKPFIKYSIFKDNQFDSNDERKAIGMYAYFIKSAYVKFELDKEEETWNYEKFQKDYYSLVGVVQMTKNLLFYSYYKYGDKINYYVENPYLGNDRYFESGIKFQPNIKWSFEVDYYNDILKYLGEKVYSVSITNISGTYQYDNHFFVRTAFRYNNYSEKLVTDFLLSYTFKPGTVAHLGYGSLYENRNPYNDSLIDYEDELINTKKSLYFKISYLW